jgi:hypothetical protein
MVDDSLLSKQKTTSDWEKRWLRQQRRFLFFGNPVWCGKIADC